MLSHELIKKFQIFSKYNHSSLDELESLVKTRKRNVLLDIDRINDTLFACGFDLIQVENNEIICPDISETELFKSLLPNMTDYLFQDERPEMIGLYLLLNKEYNSISHLEDLLRVSRNSILADIKILRQMAKKMQVELEYSRQEGYFFVGSPLHLRRFLEVTVNQLLAYASGKWLIVYILHYLGMPNQVKEISDALTGLGNEHHLAFISEKRKELAYVLALLNTQPFDTYLTDDNLLEGRKEWYQLEHMLLTFYQEYPLLEKEDAFISSRIIGCLQGDLHQRYQEDVYDIMEEIISSVSVNTGLVLNDTLNLRKNLYSHLLPAYYRILYDVEMVNPLKDQIKENYASLFYLVKRSLLPLEEKLGKDISDDEVAYFTIHFGGSLESPHKRAENQLVALSVCPNGVSSSLLLQSELKALFPQIQFIEIHQLDKILYLDEASYDLVFSTVHFDCQKPVYIAQPLMRPIEKMLLKKQVCHDFHLPQKDHLVVEELMQVISKHADIKNRDALISDLAQYIIGNHIEKELGGKGLLELLSHELITQTDSVTNWQEAIRLAAQPLLKNQSIEASYIDGMIESVNELGAYIVLAPKVAVPHASPDKGVNNLGMSLLQLQEPVSFDLEGKGDPEKEVQLVFVLAAVDTSSHLQALQELSLILEDDDNVDRIVEAKNKNEILAIISQIIQEGDL